MEKEKVKSDVGEKSKYDPSRPTIGKLYRDLQIDNTTKPEFIETGDMVREMMKSYVEDLNSGIAAGCKEFEGKPFYVLIHEKKDLQMPSALLRRIIKQLYRPYPEDDMDVYWHQPSSGITRHCWSLPHWSEMSNILANAWLYEKELVQNIKAWRANDLYFFGFVKDEIGNWMPNPKWQDKNINEYRKAS